jgi:RNA polymerase sigma-70 factor (ECF subfamily)
MSRQDRMAEQFERQRPHLRSVAYRMLGSLTEADDAVQEAWVRLDRRDPAGSDDLRGWLTVVVGRICLDMLRARRAKREEYAGIWLPEPIVTPLGGSKPVPVAPVAPGDVARDVEMADTVGLAMLVVLETLEPAERLAFVLHDVFGEPFDEIASIVDRSPVAARHLASRARRRIKATAPTPDADRSVQRRAVDAFLAAARNGDFAALLRVLDPDVVLRTDGGGMGPLARRPIVGATDVAGQIAGQGGRFAALARPALVNGAAGAIVDQPGTTPIIVAFTVVNGLIAAIDIVGDPSKLSGLAGRELHATEGSARGSRRRD